MKGWKTKLGAALTGLGGILKTLGESGTEPAILVPLGEVLLYVGGPLTLWGLGHKLEKAARGDV
jgi:hypothetical protein